MMNAEYYVRQVEKLDKLIANKLIEKEQWKSIAMNTTTANEGDRVKSSHNQQKMAEAVHRMVDLEKEIDEAVDVFIDYKKEVIKTLESLDAVEYDIMHKLYIQYMDMHAVADAYDKSYSWVVGKRRKALKQIHQIIKKGAKNDQD